jgi:hypothetical protein
VPPKEWTGADFDDNQWTRIAGKPLGPRIGAKNSQKELADAGITGLNGGSPALAMLCLRGRFGVADPAAVKDLTLSVRFHGGVIVYVK